MSEEGFNGWGNYETWTVDVLMSNNEAIYNNVTRIIRETKDDTEGAKSIKKYMRGAKVGSLRGVNWKEIAEAWRY